MLVVVTPEESVARWAGRPIALGGGQIWSPLVLGPADVPVITDPAIAMGQPDLSVLSALAHARHETETALMHRLRALTEEQLGALIGRAALVQSAEELLVH